MLDVVHGLRGTHMYERYTAGKREGKTRCQFDSQQTVEMTDPKGGFFTCVGSFALVV